MLLTKISSSIDMKQYLKALGVDDGGIGILSSKAKVHRFKIENLHVGAANILKQDALSIGADLAVPKGTVTAKHSHVDALLLATTRQLHVLAKKELAQPFGLKTLAQELQRHVKAQQPREIAVMGVINANDDSFYAQSRFSGKAAVSRMISMIEEGADIIDIGAVSSRPGSEGVDAAEELARMTPILDAVATEKLYDQVRFSIDSYTPKVVEYALSKGVGIVNDITGFGSDELCRLCAEYEATAVIMHMQGTPKEMQNHPQYSNVVAEVSDFFANRVDKAERFGIKNIILDVGIGFGKTLQHNIELLSSLEHFLQFNKALMIGASRKSMIHHIIPTVPQDRLSGTLALHLKALDNGASILRVHDVKEHVQALKVYQALQSV